MGIILKVTPAVLIKMANDIEGQLHNIQGQFNGITSEIGRTRNFWEGEASETHKAQYDALVPELQKCMERLQKRPEELLKMADLYERTEETAQETAMALQEDVIV